jgi:hypothetical protein
MQDVDDAPCQIFFIFMITLPSHALSVPEKGIYDFYSLAKCKNFPEAMVTVPSDVYPGKF